MPSCGPPAFCWSWNTGKTTGTYSWTARTNPSSTSCSTRSTCWLHRSTNSALKSGPSAARIMLPSPSGAPTNCANSGSPAVKPRAHEFLSFEPANVYPMNLVLFDLDNTLLAGDSVYEWGQFLIAKDEADGAHYEAKNRAFYEDYKAGQLDIYAFLAFALRPLVTYTRAQLDAWHAEYMETRIRPMITQAARDLVNKHLDSADLVAVITATNSFVTGPITKKNKKPHLIATDPEEIDGRFTGEVAGTPCFREGKVVRLEQFLEARGTRLDCLTTSWFYSDSLNDLPLLEKVRHPVAVDPDATLRAHAEARNWPVISLRPPSLQGHMHP